MKTLMMIFAALVSAQALAQTSVELKYVASIPTEANELSTRQAVFGAKSRLSDVIREALRLEFGGHSQGLRIDFKSMTCTDTEPSSMDESVQGVCMVSVQGPNLISTVAILRSHGDFSAKVLIADVE